MIPISERITIPLSPLIVWPLLCDLEILFTMIPGATLTARGAAAAHGALRVEIGPSFALFRGQATFTYDRQAKRVGVVLQAVDARSNSSLSGKLVAGIGGSGTTTLSLDGGIVVSGALKDAAATAAAHIMRALTDQLGYRLVARAAAEREGRQGAPAPDAAVLTMVGFEDIPASPSLPPVPASRALVPVQPPGLVRAAIRRWHELVGWLGHIRPRGDAALPR